MYIRVYKKRKINNTNYILLARNWVKFGETRIELYLKEKATTAPTEEANFIILKTKTNNTDYEEIVAERHTLMAAIIVYKDLIEKMG